MTAPGSAGTAADGFRARALDHAYQEGPTDPGMRPYCTECLQERHETTPLIPTQRTQEDR